MKEYPQWRHEAAVYVLGALTSRQRYEFELHLRHCPACRNELVWLAGLTGLLRRLSAVEAENLVGGERHTAPRNPDGPPDPYNG